MAQINLEKVTTAQNAPVGKLGIFVTPDNEAFLIDESGAVYAFGGGATSFLALSDVPASYVGQAGKVVKVNVGATGLEFAESSDYTAGDGLTLTGTVFKLGDDVGILYTPPTGPTTYDGIFEINGALKNYEYRDYGGGDIAEVYFDSGVTGLLVRPRLYHDIYRNDLVSTIISDISATRATNFLQVRDNGTNVKSASVNLTTESNRASADIGFTGDFTDKSGAMKIEMLKSGLTETFLLTDSIRSKGIEYAADYSANFTDRSLVDKAYVDSAGGSGTVTSVAISGTDGIEVDSGSPITGAGTITLGLNATTIKATAFPEAVERENDTVLFDQNYITGNTAVRTGNILFDFTGAKLGAVTRILHNSGTKPTIPAEGILISGSYTISVNNYIWFCITDIGSGTEKVEITVGQSSTW